MFENWTPLFCNSRGGSVFFHFWSGSLFGQKSWESSMCWIFFTSPLTLHWILKANRVQYNVNSRRGQGGGWVSHFESDLFGTCLQFCRFLCQPLASIRANACIIQHIIEKNFPQELEGPWASEDFWPTVRPFLQVPPEKQSGRNLRSEQGEWRISLLHGDSSHSVCSSK